MSTVTLPWNDGSGQSLEVTFSGTGNGTISLVSPRNSTGITRTLTLTVSVVGDSSISHTVTVTQKSGDRFITFGGAPLSTSDNKEFLVVDPIPPEESGSDDNESEE